MTNLTEKWKKGELPEGHYYVKDGENMIAEYLDGYFYNDGNPMTSFSGGVDEVIAPVPSYEQWYQTYKTKFEFLEEIIKLRELLKEIRDSIAESQLKLTPEGFKLITEIVSKIDGVQDD